jgi:hypothetical protein
MKSTGAFKSPYDIRTFSYIPTAAGYDGGEKWLPQYIDDQHHVGICTAISTTMRAGRHYGIRFNADFQYLIQKKEYDKAWFEGSSIINALKVGKNVGFLPESEWTHTTIEDRKLNYEDYIKKLQAIPDTEIERLKQIASKYRLKAFAFVPVTRETLANAVDNSGALLERFDIGSEWWTAPIEPIRPPREVISGHAVNSTKYSGNSSRVANSWGVDWADQGTAYHSLNNYKPTEAWAVWFEEVPKEIEIQIESRSTIVGKILDLLQQIIVLVTKLK